MHWMDRLEVDLRTPGTSGTSVLVEDNELYSAALGAWGVVDLYTRPPVNVRFDQYKHPELVELIKAKDHEKVVEVTWKLVGEWVGKNPGELQAFLERTYKNGFRSGSVTKMREIRKVIGATGRDPYIQDDEIDC